MWTCPRCNEANEDQFSSCWKCTPVDEEAVRSAPPESPRRDNAEWPAIFGALPVVQPAPEEPVVRVTPQGTVRCPTCGDIFRVKE